MRTANPALNEKTFQTYTTGWGGSTGIGNVMTVDGTVRRSAIMLFLVVLGAAWTWLRFTQGALSEVMLYMIGGVVGGLVLALITVFKKQWSPFTAPAYALLEGLALGGISAFFELMYPGIVLQAVGLTFGTFFALLLAYQARLIKVTEKFRMGVVVATGGVMIVYLLSFVLGFFGMEVPYIHGSGLIGIGFSLVVVTIASLNLVLDFDFIERGAQAGAPKFMEWYAAFGLTVTLVWLYLEMLRLLAKLNRR